MSFVKKIILLTTVISISLVLIETYSLWETPSLPKLENTWWGSGTPPEKEDYIIKPFKVHVADEVLEDLQRRLETTKSFTPPLEGIQQQYGFNTNLLQELIDFWTTNYKWRERETFLNKFPQFTTKIQGLDLHFIHLKPTLSPNIHVLPILLLHGWPSSVREFYDVIPVLTQLRNQNFAFEVIVPSLPGFRFSEAASKPGLGDVQIAVLFKNLMKRLGHEKFYVHGSDWGGNIAAHLGTVFPDNILGLHSNTCLANSLIASLKLWIGSVFPSVFIEERFERLMYPLMEKFMFMVEETGYLHLQTTKPDTLGVALNESPAGLAAYILERFSIGTRPSNKFREDGGLLEKFTYTELLDNVMLYWITGSATTAARIYAESFNEFTSNIVSIPIDEKVPCACARFAHQALYFTVWILKEKYTNLVHSTDFPTGGHFATLEEPQLVANDIIAAVAKMEQIRDYKL